MTRRQRKKQAILTRPCTLREAMGRGPLVIRLFRWCAKHPKWCPNIARVKEKKERQMNRKTRGWVRRRRV